MQGGEGLKDRRRKYISQVNFHFRDCVRLQRKMNTEAASCDASGAANSDFPIIFSIDKIDLRQSQQHCHAGCSQKDPFFPDGETGQFFKSERIHIKLHFVSGCDFKRSEIF